MHFKKILIFTVLFLPNFLLAENVRDIEILQKKKPAFYSYIISDIKSGKITDEALANIYTAPASCQKVITAILALKSLGPEYRYKTELLAQKHHKEFQNIILSFSGDPTFSSEQLLTLLSPLKNSSISGKIFIYNAAFKAPEYSTNIMVYDLGSRYSPPVSATNIDHNLIDITVKPATVNNKKAIISTNLPYEIDNQVITNKANSSIKAMWKDDKISITGNININDKSLVKKLSPQKTSFYTKNKVKRVLEKLHITGKVEFISNIPGGFTVINQVYSAPLKEFLPPNLKMSDNLVFDSLYLTMLQNEEPNGIQDWSEGDAIFKKILQKHYPDIDVSDALFIDGSGLSRHNRITAHQLLLILQEGFKIPEFVFSLAKPGEEQSTMGNRNLLPETLKVKTGSLFGINCLCGYNIGKNPKAFAIIANSFTPPAKELVSIIDEFLTEKLKE